MNISNVSAKTVFLTLIFLFSAVPTQAQPIGTHRPSVEWVAANSCLIVRGVIDDVSLRDPDDVSYRNQTVSVRVLETIKGKHSDRLQFVNGLHFQTVTVSELQQSNQEVLLFLNSWMRDQLFSRHVADYVYSRFPYVVKRAVILTPQDLRFTQSNFPLLSANMESFATSAELIGATKYYLKNRRQDVPARRITIAMPPERDKSGFGLDSFTFPADARVEKPELRKLVASLPILKFDTFKKQYGKALPDKQKPPYLRSQSGYVGVYALELMAADCDVVVRGVIEESCFVALSDDPTGYHYGVKLRVLETLKGEAAEELDIYVSDGRDLAKLMRDKQELVLFLRSNRDRRVDYPAGALEYRTRDTLWDDSVIVLEDKQAEVLFADMTWHRKPLEILKRLRFFIKESKEGEFEQMSNCDFDTGPPIFNFYPPVTLVGEASVAGNKDAVLYLPVDRMLEANVRKWLSSDSQDLRWLAARAMIYFKSEKNAKLLRKMLDDNTTWNREEMFQMLRHYVPRKEPKHLVRWEAWHLLRAWEYDAPRPEFGSNKLD